VSEPARAATLTVPALVALLVFVLINATLVTISGVRIGGDSGMYLDGARALASGEPLSVRQPSYAAYIAFISVIQSIGGGMIGVVLAQVAAALGAAVVVGKMAAHLAGPVAAVIAILLFAIDVETNRWHAFILSDSLFLSMLTLATWLVYRACRLRHGATAALALFVMLLAALVRPEGWFLLPAAVAFWIASATAGATRLIAATALLVLGGVLVFALVPRLSGNLAAVGPAEMLRRGQTIWDFDGWRIEMPPDAVFNDGHPAPADAIVYAWRHPASTVTLMAARVGVHFAHVRPYFSAAHNAFVVVWLAPVYVLAAWGFWRWRRHPLSPWCLAVIATQTAIVALTHADWDGRYLAHVLPLMYPFTAGGAMQLIGRWRMGVMPGAGIA
jgi:hypothetical protein